MDTEIDVFMSYATEDRPRIQPLVSLIDAQGCSVWWDRDIAPGQEWRGSIEMALEQARCVIVAWSRTSVEKSWIQAEADRGMRRRILLPVMIEEATPPLLYRHIQTVNLSEWNGSGRHPEARRLIEALNELLNGGPSVQTTSASQRKSHGPRTIDQMVLGRWQIQMTSASDRTYLALQISSGNSFQAKGGPWPMGYFTVSGSWEVIGPNAMMFSGNQVSEFGNHGLFRQKVQFSQTSDDMFVGINDLGEQMVWRRAAEEGPLEPTIW